MYNAPVKERFLREYVGDNDPLLRMYHSVFSVSEPYEAKYGHDLYQFSIDEAQDLCANTLGVRISSRETSIARIRVYCDWCYFENIVGATTSFHNVDHTKTELTKIQMVGSPKDLHHRLSLIFRPERDESTDDPFRAVFWLAFSGIETWEDALRITCDDVDLDKLVINFEGNQYPIYKESIPVFTNLVTLTSFNHEHRDVIRRADRVQSRQLLRGIKADMKYGTARSKYYKMADKFKADGVIEDILDYRDAYRSGLFYKVYIDEVIDGVDPESQFKRMALYKLQKLGHGTENTKRNRRFLKEFQDDIIRDYKEWKNIFAIK